MNNKLNNHELDMQATVFEATGSPTFAAVFREALAYREAESKPVAWIVHTHGPDQLTTDGDYVANAEGMHGLNSTPLYASPVLSQPVPDEMAIAQAIWSVRAVEEDRMDMELEDLDDTHSVFYEARAVRVVLLSASPALTAAAPELLEALQTLLSDLNPVPPTTVSKMYANVTVANVIRARSAIAKATGECE